MEIYAALGGVSSCGANGSRVLVGRVSSRTSSVSKQSERCVTKVSTQTGLTVTVTMLEQVYETGRKCAERFKESMTIAFDKVLPKWNYRAIPSKS